ncbi:MAG: DUF4296 domain-containing protein [Bacteroidota bacterium]|jgi:hypothetical protein
MDVKIKSRCCYDLTLFFTALIMLGLGCKPANKQSKPKNIIGRDTMVMILADIHLLEASLGIKVFEDRKMNETRNHIKEKIYKKYLVNKIQFRSSYDYYAMQSANIDSIYIDVISEISKQQAEIKK